MARDSMPPLLVGRGRELAALRQSAAAALAGAGSLVLLGGAAGLGKTTLGEVICQELAGRALVLAGRCYDLADPPPYGLWIELFRHYRWEDRQSPPPEAFAQRGAIGEIASQARFFQQMLDFLADRSARWPLVLFLDDLHWADPASLDLLRFLAREVARLPLLILATYRSDEVPRGHPLHALFPHLVREAKATRIELRPLAEGAVRELIAARYPLPDPEAARLVEFVQARAEGNPFFAGELLRSLVEADTLRQDGERWTLGDLARATLPLLLRQVIEQRVAQLSAAGQRLLALASVLGQEVPLATLGTTAAMEDETLLNLMEETSGARLLVESADGLHARFAHALIREAIYEGISPARRRTMHARAAQLLAVSSQPDPEALAHHFQRAGDPRAAEWLIRAGERAQLAYAWLTASERYEAALAALGDGDATLAQRGWLHYRIARMRRYGAYREAITHLDRALLIAARVGDRALAAAARYTRGLCLGFAGDAIAIDDMIAGVEALEALSPADQTRLDLGPDEDGQPTITNPRGMLIAIMGSLRPVAEVLAMGEATREALPRYTPLSELGWSNHGARELGLGCAYALAGNPARAREAFSFAHEKFRRIGNFSSLATGSILDLFFVSLPYFADNRDDRDHLATAIADGVRRSNTTAVRNEGFGQMLVDASAGCWQEACEEGAIALRMQWQRIWHQIARITLGEIARARGDVAAVREHLRMALPRGPRAAQGREDHAVGLALLRLGAAAHLDTGELSQAHEWLFAHDRWLDWAGIRLGRADGHGLWARYYRQRGEIERAWAHARHSFDHASVPRQPLALLAACRLLAGLHTEAREYDEAARQLGESLRLADACEMPYERALTLLALAELRAATGDTGAVTPLLEEVHAICEPLAAAPALARADALAGRLAALPPAAAYPANLSGREVDVLRLVAQGLTSAQVAEQLSLSTRTIEHHLLHVYGKLGVSTRAAAAHFAVRHGLV